LSLVSSKRQPSTWKDVDWLRSITKLPLLLKGILDDRGHRLDDVRPAADAAVDEDRNPAHALGDRRQRVDGRGDGVQITRTVIRDDDPRRAMLGAELRVSVRELDRSVLW